MTARVILYTAILAGIALVQTNVLQAVEIAGVRPDLALIVIAFFANTNGSYEAQIGAFVGGLVEDFLSLAPPGFHALVRTTMGLLFGMTQNKILVDAVLVPVLLIGLGTLVKAAAAALVAAIFGIEGVATTALSSRLLIEIAYNSLLAPILFALLRLVKPLHRSRMEAAV